MRLRLAFLPLAIVVGVAIAPSSSLGAVPAATQHLCTNPTQTSSSPSAEEPHGRFVVSQDTWNDVNIKSTLASCTKGSWNETATASGTAVQAYPDTNYTYPTATAISSFDGNLPSNFDVVMPPASHVDAEAAYDIWIGGSSIWSGKSTEYMIWTYNEGQTPAGKDLGTTSIGGVTWTVWEGSDPSGDIVTLVSPNTSDSSLNLVSFFSYATSKGWMVGQYLWQVGGGFEVCATPSGGATFSVTEFTLPKP